MKRKTRSNPLQWTGYSWSECCGNCRIQNLSCNERCMDTKLYTDLILQVQFAGITELGFTRYSKTPRIYWE